MITYEGILGSLSFVTYKLLLVKTFKTEKVVAIENLQGRDSCVCRISYVSVNHINNNREYQSPFFQAWTASQARRPDQYAFPFRQHALLNSMVGKQTGSDASNKVTDTSASLNSGIYIWIASH